MSLVTTQNRNGDVTRYRSFKTLRNGQWIVSLEISEGYTPAGDMRRNTFLQLTPETANQLAGQLAALARGRVD